MRKEACIIQFTFPIAESTRFKSFSLKFQQKLAHFSGVKLRTTWALIINKTKVKKENNKCFEKTSWKNYRIILTPDPGKSLTSALMPSDSEKLMN